jgi:hypothetical protein
MWNLVKNKTKKTWKEKGGFLERYRRTSRMGRVERESNGVFNMIKVLYMNA